eukprot:jgi/Undpi1/8935/HiC_scaffold_26.g11396.m1
MRGWPPPSFVFSSYVGVRRAIVGFGVGGNLPVSLALFTEFLPTKQQATLLCYWNGLFWGAGIICASLIGLIFSNALGRGGEQKSEAINASSGEFYGRKDKAGKAQAGDVRELFHTPILRMVTLCIGSRSTRSCQCLSKSLSNPTRSAAPSFYGLTFVLPKYYEKIGSTTGFVYIVSAVLGLFFCSENRLGRVGTLKWSSLATAVLILLMAFSHGTTALFVPLSMVTILAIGMLAPILAEVLYDRGSVWPLVVFCSTMIVVATFAGLIPVETAGRKLDDDSWDHVRTSHDSKDLADWLGKRGDGEDKSNPE